MSDKQVGSTRVFRKDVSALWIGGPLGHLEHLALRSFRDHGFTVNLYT